MPGTKNMLLKKLTVFRVGNDEHILRDQNMLHSKLVDRWLFARVELRFSKARSWHR